MTFNVDWDVNNHEDKHESEDQWELRKAFMIKWKNQYSEERLVCLARVFINMEFLGCRYPNEVMQEVNRLSRDIMKVYRNKQKNRLKRTFVSASAAAEDYVRGTIENNTATPKCKKKKQVKKPKKITFVPQCQSDSEKDTVDNENNDYISLTDLVQNMPEYEPKSKKSRNNHSTTSDIDITIQEKCEYNVNQKNLMLFYTNQMSEIKCLNPALFNEKMFDTEYGKFVFVILPWNDIASNIKNSCMCCKVSVTQRYKDRAFTLTVNGKVMARAEGSIKESRNAALNTAWNYFRNNTICLMMKEEWIPQNDTRISISDLSVKNEIDIPIKDTVAWKMMKLMGWKGGGLGVDSQGIAEPIKANLKMKSRLGFGHEAGERTAIRRAAMALMKGHTDALDGDLVFSNEFTPEQRAVIHRCAEECDLVSKSYGRKGQNRFLVVSNKVHPFTLVPAITQRGGETPKYQVFIPEKLADIK